MFFGKANYVFLNRSEPVLLDLKCKMFILACSQKKIYQRVLYNTVFSQKILIFRFQFAINTTLAIFFKTFKIKMVH